MTFEIIKDGEFEQTAAMIERSVRFSAFAEFYPQCSLEYVIEGHDADSLRRLASDGHLYVIKEAGRIIGCGAVEPYNGSENESAISSVFIDPEYQGRSYGRRLIGILESDELFKGSRRTEISAAISAVPFYRKLGYEHKNNELIYEDGQILLEKKR